MPSVSERMQLTVCAETEHVHPVPDALIGVRPRGSVSLTVTTPFVAPRRLTFETVRVKLAAEPRVKFAYVDLANRKVRRAQCRVTAFP